LTGIVAGRSWIGDPIMRHISEARALLRTADEFRAWIKEGEGLVAAADLLGGADWSARATAVVEAVRAGSGPAEHLVELRAFRRLLSLELADHPGSPEAAQFAAVHPDDSRADAARRCAEALERGLEAVAALKGAAVPYRAVA